MAKHIISDINQMTTDIISDIH